MSCTGLIPSVASALLEHKQNAINIYGFAKSSADSFRSDTAAEKPVKVEHHTMMLTG